MWGVVCSLFFLSGLTSLVYETIWIRVISLGVGSTSAAMSIVLGLFFLGLSLGSWASSKWITSHPRPLLLYAGLEGAIGLAGLVLIHGLIHFHSLLALFPVGSSLSWGATLVKFLLVGLLILFPTLAMGATLPLVVKVFDRFPGGEARSVSLLYAINTLGGVAGAWLAAFILIPKFGILVSNQLCAVANLILCVAGILIDRWLAKREDLSPFTDVKENVPFSRSNWELIALTGICGFSSLASEVVWNKYLGIFLGNNIYGLGIVLAIYLLGIALGSLLLYAFLPRLKEPRKLFYWCLFLLPLSLALTSYVFNQMPVAASYLGYYSADFIDLLYIKSALAAFLLLPSTILLGLLFPLTVHLISDQKSSHRAVGIAYATNTIGAILGSCLAGLVLIPLLGSSHTIRIAAALVILSTLLFVWKGSHRPRKAFLGLSVISILTLVFFGNLDFQNIIKSAYVQKYLPGTSLAEHMRPYAKNQEEFKWIREGETSVITLSQDPADGEHFRDFLRLKTNGLNESVYVLRRLEELPRYEALLGLLPYLFTENPKSAFVVGYGGGYTVDLLSSFPIEKVHVVELEKAIMEAQEQVYNGRNPILRRRNLDLTIEDARFVLASKQKAPLDIIVSQPSHSWLAGAANLFTKEFFEIVKANLSPNGVFSQWLNLYNMDVQTLKSILATFYEVFPQGAVFSGQNDQEMILIGSMTPLRFNSMEARRLADSPRYQRRLAGVPFTGPSDIIAHFALGRQQIHALTENAKLNTDINAYAETRQSRTFYEGIIRQELPQAFLAANYQAGFSGFLDTSQDWAYEILLSLQNTQQFDKFYTFLWQFENRVAADPKRHAQLGYLCQRSQRYDSAHYYLKSAFKLQPSAQNLAMLLSNLTDTERYGEALTLIRAHRDKTSPMISCYEARALLAQDKLAQAAPLMERFLTDINGYTEQCGDLFNRITGDYFFQKKDYPIAIRFYEAYRQRYPNDIAPLQRLSVSYLNLKEWEHASEVSENIKASVNWRKEQLSSLANFYKNNNLERDANALQLQMQSIGLSE